MWEFADFSITQADVFCKIAFKLTQLQKEYKVNKQQKTLNRKKISCIFFYATLRPTYHSVWICYHQLIMANNGGQIERLSTDNTFIYYVNV
jgi:hypothetical protein